MLAGATGRGEGEAAGTKLAPINPRLAPLARSGKEDPPDPRQHLGSGGSRGSEHAPPVPPASSSARQQRGSGSSGGSSDPARPWSAGSSPGVPLPATLSGAGSPERAQPAFSASAALALGGQPSPGPDGSQSAPMTAFHRKSGPDTGGLDSETAQALRQFMRRNRSPTSFGAVASSGSELTGAPLECELEGRLSQNSQSARPIAKGSITKFDIFDTIDEERLQEFEHMTKQKDVSSTYDAFVKRKKKGNLDASKFMTAMGIVRGSGSDGVMELH